MLPKIVISPDKSTQIKEVERWMDNSNLQKNSSDLLWMENDSKSWSVKDIKDVKDHFFLKGEKPKVVVIIEANKLSEEAQTGLLKLLEETPGNGRLILTVDNENSLLPTILSRCEIIKVPNTQFRISDRRQVEKFLGSNIAQRFILIESLDDKNKFLNDLAVYISQRLTENHQLINLAQTILEGQKLAGSNGNTRAILEYIALSF